MDTDTKELFQITLQMLKDQATYLHRQHGWMIAIAETMRRDSSIAQELSAHHFWNQGPREDERITRAMIQNIDALIQRLSK